MSTPTPPPAPWAHLPNAAHIDQLLQHARDPQRDWDAAWDAAWAAVRDAARTSTWDAARTSTWDAARAAVRDAAREAAWDAAWGAAWGAAWEAAWDAAWGAAIALIAWDDAARWLDPATPSDALRAYAAVAPGTPLAHAALLLLPYKLVLETSSAQSAP